MQYFEHICQLKAIIARGYELDENSFGSFFDVIILEFEEKYKKLEDRNFSTVTNDLRLGTKSIFKIRFSSHILYTINEEGNF